MAEFGNIDRELEQYGVWVKSDSVETENCQDDHNKIKADEKNSEINDEDEKSVDDVLPLTEEEELLLRDLEEDIDDKKIFSGALPDEKAESMKDKKPENDFCNDTVPEKGESKEMLSQFIKELKEELISIKEELRELKEELGAYCKKEEEPEGSVEPEEEEKKQAQPSKGFFSDDGDETIALTENELDNIFNTADFTENTGAEDSEEEPDIEPESAKDENESEIIKEDDVPFVEPKEEDAGSLVGPEEEEEEIVIDSSEEEDKNEGAGPKEEETAGAEAGFGIDDLLSEENIAEKEVPAEEPVAEELKAEEISEAEKEGPEFEIPEELKPEEVFKSEPKEGIPAEEAKDIEESAKTEEEGPEEELSIEDLEPEEISEIQEEESEFELPEELSAFPEDKPKEEEAAEEAEGKEKEEKEEEWDNFPDPLKNEIKSVLIYLDQLLESLPEAKIEEFAKSEHFITYKKLFKELGLL